MSDESCCKTCRYRAYLEESLCEGEKFLREILTIVLDEPFGRAASKLSEGPFEHVVYTTARIPVLKAIRSVIDRMVRRGFRPRLDVVRERILEWAIDDPFRGERTLTILRARHAVLISELCVLEDRFGIRGPRLGELPSQDRLSWAETGGRVG